MRNTALPVSKYQALSSDKDITMIPKGRLAEPMVQVVSNLYRKYKSVDRKGTAIISLKMQKAMYSSGVPYFSIKSLLPTWRASSSCLIPMTLV
jgi:hypothetical protein